jgi:uncharacterized protein (TIGR03437 family)
VLALHGDGTLNDRNNGARPGEVVTLWATGLGAMSPAVEAGKVANRNGPYARPVQPVRVQVERFGAEVLYVGSAPSLLHGIVQVNVRIPNLPPGNYSIELSPAAFPSPLGTIWVR